MKKKITLPLLVIVLLLAFLVPGPILAAGGVLVHSSTVVVDFPASLEFKLVAESDVDIIDIRLNYTVDYIALAEVNSEVYIDFMPATTVDAGWKWDMRTTGGFPPGAKLAYWWSVTDADGEKVVTDPVEFTIEDKDHEWRQLSQGKVTIYWYEGDDSFAGELMANAQGVLSRLANETGAELQNPVKLYIYANSRDLRGSMINPQEWTGGVAFTRFGIIAIGIIPDNLDWGKRAIAHELTHLVVHQVTLNPYGGMPTWLDEGLAMKSEGDMEITFETALHNAITENSLISVQSLSSPFSAFPAQSALAYAESLSLVDYLIEEYGREQMFELLNTFSRGSDYDAALESVYGFDMDGLDEQWRESLGITETGQPEVSITAENKESDQQQGFPIVIFLLLAGLVVVIILLVVVLRGNRI